MLKPAGLAPSNQAMLDAKESVPPKQSNWACQVPTCLTLERERSMMPSSAGSGFKMKRKRGFEEETCQG